MATMMLTWSWTHYIFSLAYNVVANSLMPSTKLHHLIWCVELCGPYYYPSKKHVGLQCSDPLNYVSPCFHLSLRSYLQSKWSNFTTTRIAGYLIWSTRLKNQYPHLFHWTLHEYQTFVDQPKGYKSFDYYVMVCSTIEVVTSLTILLNLVKDLVGKYKYKHISSLLCQQ